MSYKRCNHSFGCKSFLLGLPYIGHPGTRAPGHPGTRALSAQAPTAYAIPPEVVSEAIVNAIGFIQV